MAGIYIHIPFCERKCIYCSFYSLADTKSYQPYIDALKKEMVQRRDYLPQGEIIETLYLGGGTPSLLEIPQLVEIFKALEQNFDLSHLKEISFEANPESLAREKGNYLKDLKNYTPINRLSIGVQAFDDALLKTLNRAHSSAQAKDIIQKAKAENFQLSIDLIYGLPKLSQALWAQELEILRGFEIDHFSAYILTIEKGTALYTMEKKGLFIPPPEGETLEQYQYLMSWIEKNHFEAYETSNFARAGAYSLHNSNYWKEKAYLGLGASAHSYDGKSRQANCSDLAKYIGGQQRISSYELLSEEDIYNEWMMTALRTQWGLNKDRLAQFSKPIQAHFFEKTAPALSKGELLENQEAYILAGHARIFVDRLSLDFFI